MMFGLQFLCNYFLLLLTKPFLEFKIIDDGKGFSEEDLKNATELFYTSKSNSGLFGIGLTISKILCEKHNGSIKFKNSKDKGALVLVKIKKLWIFD